MKRKTIYYVGIALIAILLFVWYSISDFSIMNLIPQPHLPARYTAYREIEQSVSSNHYSTRLLFHNSTETHLDGEPPLFNAVNNTVMISKQLALKKDGHTTGFVETYLKLDATGKLIDSLRINNVSPSSFGSYLVTPNTYCSWMLDGDKTMHPYEERNISLNADSSSLAQQFKQLYATSSLVYYYSTFDLGNPRLQQLNADKVIFYRGGRWIALLGKNLFDLENHGYPTKSVSTISAMQNLADVKFLGQKNHFLYLDYFYKKHYVKGRGSALGSVTGNTSQDHWEGTAYLNLILKSDTLRIKQAMTKDDESSPSTYYGRAFTYYFTNPKLSFGLFANDNFNVYLIRRKGL